MRRAVHLGWLVVLGLGWLLSAGCSSGDGSAESPTGSGGAGVGGATAGGNGGSSASGTGGTSATGGSGGIPAQCTTPNPGEISTVQQCGSLGAAPSNGTCTVTPGTQATVYRGVVLGPDVVYEGGEVLVDEQGFISCVGCDCSASPAYAVARKVTCPEGVISPGLINAHDHLTYANNPPFGTGNYEALKDVRYDHRHEWRKGLNGKPEIPYASGASQAQQAAAELRFMMSGVTSTNGSNGASGILRNLDKDSLLDGLGMPALKYDTFPLGDSNGTMLDSGCGYPKPVSGASAQANPFYTPHVAEGINKAARNEFVCESQGNTDLLFASAGWIHGVGMIAADARTFSQDRTKLIWSPRSNVSLYGDTARVPLFHKAGAVVALGTDWMPSGSMNMQRELQCVRDLNTAQWSDYFSDEQIWRMVTSNGAFATGFQKAIGLLKKGYAADLTIFNGRTNVRHAAVVKAGLADTVLVLRGGRVMYGDSQLLTDLGNGACEDVPAAGDSNQNPAWKTGVCGVPKKACVSSDPDVESGVTLSSINAAIQSIYPLYFCGTPTHEPSCVPSRPGQYPVANDKDGDGVADSQDNCPGHFNAIRPLDDGKQQDFDGDGLGDECDPCPFDAANDACSYNWSANDMDCDGIKNAADNCPMVPNPEQTDGDDDGKGDPCDSCPTSPNPGPASCTGGGTQSIDQVRQSAAANDPVNLPGVVVTGVRKNVGGSNGFYVSDKTQGPYHCIFAFTGATVPTWSTGDIVDLKGSYKVYNGLAEIASPTATLVSKGAPLPELDVTITELIGAQAASFESCRVRLQGVTGIAMGTGVGLEQAGQQIKANNYIWAGGAFVTAGTSYKEARGFAGVYQSTRELLPQSDADLLQ